MPFRYKNIKLDYMEKITIDINKDGAKIIYVEKCKNFQNKHWKYYETLDNI